MKVFFRMIGITIALVSSSQAKAAVILACGGGEITNGDKSWVAGVVEEIDPLYCTTFNGDRKYTMKIKGYGAGLRIGFGQAFILNCPTVRAEALGVDEFISRSGRIRKGVTEFFGPKASIVPGFGVDAGFYVNSKAGMCTLTGLQAGLGGSFTISKMTITRD